MKEIKSLKSLREIIESSDKTWLLLYKKGATLSDCAIKNFEELARRHTALNLYSADVNTANDIHPEYGINSVPTLMLFEKTQVKKVIKGCHQPEQFEAFIKGKTVISSRETNNKSPLNVTVYTTPTCSWCTAVKRHLKAHRIPFREINVAADPQAAEAMIRKSGQQGVPQTEINGQMIVGFDKTKINSLLGIN